MEGFIEWEIAEASLKSFMKILINFPPQIVNFSHINCFSPPKNYENNTFYIKFILLIIVAKEQIISQCICEVGPNNFQKYCTKCSDVYIWHSMQDIANSFSYKLA